MKNIYPLLICAVLSFSCSLGSWSLSSAGTPTAQYTATNTRTPRPTATPLTPSLTFTLTPTQVGLKSPTPTQVITDTPAVSMTPFALITPNTATPTLQMEGFLGITVFGTEFYKTPQCQPGSIKFTVQVADPVNSVIVDLFVRFNSKREGTLGEWTRINMQTIGAGTFTHDLIPQEIKGFEIFRNTWVQYQLVASTLGGREVGRTEIFKESLAMVECILTPTPSITPTPTVLKP